MHTITPQNIIRDTGHINKINPLKDAVIAVFKSHEEVDDAIKKLIRTEFNIKQISIMGRGYHSEETVTGFYNALDRIKLWGKYGALWGGLWGLLVGGAYITVPALGSFVILGPMASMVISALEGAALTGGLTALGAGLYSIGIPKNSIVKYEETIKSNGFIIIVYGTPDEIILAKNILGYCQPESIEIFEHIQLSESDNADSVALTTMVSHS